MDFLPAAAFYTPQAFGFYLPPLLVWALLAIAPFLALTTLFRLTGFYRLVWHRALFDVAVYVIVLGTVVCGFPATSEIAARWRPW